MDSSFFPMKKARSASTSQLQTVPQVRSELGQGHKYLFLHLGQYSNGIISVLVLVIASEKKHYSGSFSLIQLFSYEVVARMRLWEEIRSDLSQCVPEEAPEVGLNFLSCWVTFVNISKSALSPMDSGLHSGLVCEGPCSLGEITGLQDPL